MRRCVSRSVLWKIASSRFHLESQLKTIKGSAALQRQQVPKALRRQLDAAEKDAFLEQGSVSGDQTVNLTKKVESVREGEGCFCETLDAEFGASARGDEGGHARHA